MWNLKIAGACVPAVLTILAMSYATAANMPTKPANVSLGKKVYESHCAACHGINLEGQPNWRVRRPDGKLPAPPHDASGHTWEHPDATLFSIIKNGVAFHAGPRYRTDMPAFKGTLTDDEIWATIAYIKSKWPERIHKKLKTHDHKK